MFGDISEIYLILFYELHIFIVKILKRSSPVGNFGNSLWEETVFGGTDFLRVIEVPWGKMTLFAEERVQYYGIRETWWVLDPGSILITYY